MKTVQNLYDEMRLHEDITAAMNIRDAITGLLKREALYRSTQLGDNVLDLIVDELRNAIGEGGATTKFAVLNLLAAPGARVGSLNPIESATRILNEMKTGRQSEIRPAQGSGFNPPFGLVIQNRGMSAVLISSYQTNDFEISGGLFPEILTVTKHFPSGVLIYQGPDDVLPTGAFHCCDKESYELTLKKAKVVPFEEDSSLSQKLLRQALAALDSGQPAFLITSFENCSPRPNFTIPEEWPRIAVLIRDWLAINA